LGLQRLRVTVEIDTGDSFVEAFTMAEEWLKHLAETIKEKDHSAAEIAERDAHELRVIEQEGPVFWRAFGDLLKKYVDDMKADLDNDVTLRSGALSFSADSGGRFNINKEAFPFVQFSASSPTYKLRTANIAYLVINPQKNPQAGAPMTTMPCRFEVGKHDKVFLQLDGQQFHEPHEAARHVMEKLFTISS
jgi:hypothetical protein